MTESTDAARASQVPGPQAQGWYLYGVTRAAGLRVEDLNEPPSAGGDAGPFSAEPLQVVEEGGLAAVVRPVRMAEFEAEMIQARSGDRAWLEGMVSGHNDVIARIHGREAVLPARFGSIYGSLDDVRTALRQAQPDLLAQLGNFEDHDEWAVHVYVDGAKIAEQEHEDAAIRRLEEEIAAARPGRAYFLQRKLQEERAAGAQRALAAVARGTYERLSRHAAASLVTGPGRPAQAPGSDTEILRAAFLVRRGTLEDFRRELDAAEERDGIWIECTGPWPPYSFVALPEAER